MSTTPAYKAIKHIVVTTDKINLQFEYSEEEANVLAVSEKWKIAKRITEVNLF